MHATIETKRKIETIENITVIKRLTMYKQRIPTDSFLSSRFEEASQYFINFIWTSYIWTFCLYFLGHFAAFTYLKFDKYMQRMRGVCIIDGLSQ